MLSHILHLQFGISSQLKITHTLPNFLFHISQQPMITHTLSLKHLSPHLLTCHLLPHLRLLPFPSTPSPATRTNSPHLSLPPTPAPSPSPPPTYIHPLTFSPIHPSHRFPLSPTLILSSSPPPAYTPPPRLPVHPHPPPASPT